MTDEIYDFCLANEISICTSLDGPEDLHNGQRKYAQGNSFKNTYQWLCRINERNEQYRKTGIDIFYPNALITVTRKALNRYREIIDLYIDSGLYSIFLRPINPFGFAHEISDELIYTPEKFLEFYRNSIEYMVKRNREGIFFSESTAQIILTKIFKKVDPNYLDLRSPCGAAIGQLAYNYNGDIFSCDEGRMVYEMGDSIFKLGNVHEDDYQTVMRKDEVAELCTASCLEGLPGCHDCVYNPYCGVCPVYNYVSQNSLFGYMPTNDRCKIFTGIFDYLFETLDANKDVYKEWVAKQLFR
jgi:His-Xaa-Ser system radical SAM maturase HxsB